MTELHTLHSLDLPSTKSSECTLVLGSSNTSRPNWTLKIRDGSTRGGAALARLCSVGHGGRFGVLWIVRKLEVIQGVEERIHLSNKYVTSFRH